MEEQKVNIDGVEYAIESLTPEVRAQVGLYQKWAFQLSELRQEYAKTDFAVRAIAAEITNAVKKAQADVTDTAQSEEQPVAEKKHLKRNNI